MADRPHILIIEARFYEEIADELLRGAVAALERAGATFDRVAVPGALEIPAALAMALDGKRLYHGYVVLGCVIRGETSHYDIVANESAHGVARLARDHSLAVGLGLLTVENDEQAWARAKVDRMNKGGAAADTALAMVALRAKLRQ